MAVGYANATFEAQGTEDVAAIMVIAADVRAHPGLAKMRHQVRGGHAIECQADHAFAPRIVRAADYRHAGNPGKTGMVSGAVEDCIAQSGFLIMNRFRRRFDPAAAVRCIRNPAPQPFEIGHDVGECGIAARIAGALFPVLRRAADQGFFGRCGQPVRRPADAVTVTGKNFVGRDGVSVNSIGGYVDVAVTGVLDAVNDDETIRRGVAYFFGNPGHLDSDARNRRSLNDGCHTQIRTKVHAISLRRDRSGCIVVFGEQMRPLRDFRPSRHGAARGRMFKR